MNAKSLTTLLQFTPLMFLAYYFAFSFVATLGPFAFILILICLIALFLFNPETAFIALLVSLLFQSVILSVVSPLIENRSQLSTAQGLSFFIIVVQAAIGVFIVGTNKNLRQSIGWRHLYMWLWILVILCVVYLGFGIVKNGAMNAAIYFRNTIGVVFMIMIGWYMGIRLNHQTFLSYMSYMLTAALLFGAVEFLATRQLYELIHADTFFNLKYDGRYIISSLADLLEFAKRPFLNLSYLDELGLQTFRVSGPNMHAISYAYVGAFAFVFFWIRKAFFRVALALLVLLSIQAKGPFIIIIFAFIGVKLLHNSSKIKWAIFFSLLASYAVMAFKIGVATRDFHIIGLMGGVNGFLSNPIGHGLGAGGNLARESFSWSDFQNAGAADFGVESAIGVLLYQIGFCTFVFLLFYFKFGLWAARRIKERTDINQYRIIPFMGIVCVVNGLFQEEAYNNFALGFIFMTCMALISSRQSTPKFNRSFATVQKAPAYLSPNTA